jgi:hypothetical protein
VAFHIVIVPNCTKALLIAAPGNILHHDNIPSLDLTHRQILNNGLLLPQNPILLALLNIFGSDGLYFAFVFLPDVGLLEIVGEGVEHFVLLVVLLFLAEFLVV